MITALVGAQFGSEGKGAVAAALAHEYRIHVRTGAPNAGHTIYYKDKAYPMQSIPCGWINPEATLVIGPGGMIEMETLSREVDWLEDAGLSAAGRMYVDPRALILNPYFHSEGGIEGDAHRLIGSTGKGVGPCRMSHIARGTMGANWQLKHAGDLAADFTAMGITLIDVSEFLTVRAVSEWNILLEGTQGSGLSLTTGPWPYVTSGDTNAGQLCVDAGVSPQYLDDVLLVARTFPIRVAGNSGPLYEETTWEEIGVPPEYTTVTKKMRRVGAWDPHQLGKAMALNGPKCSLALMFLDYVFPEIKGATVAAEMPMHVINWLTQLQLTNGIGLRGVGTGPDTFIDIRKELVGG